MLAVGHLGVVHAEFLARAARAAFADHGERGLHGRIDHLHLRLEAHGIGQPGFQRGHIDDQASASVEGWRPASKLTSPPMSPCTSMRSTGVACSAPGRLRTDSSSAREAALSA